MILVNIANLKPGLASFRESMVAVRRNSIESQNESPMNDICSCNPELPIKLMSTLDGNPIACVACNLEVPSDRLNLNDPPMQIIVKWQTFYDAIYHLWLDSDVYEDWAKEQLSDMNSPVNLLGRELQKEIDISHRCYYWYFQDQSDDKYSPITTCPICDAPLDEYPDGNFLQRVCEDCGIICSGD